jgi:hypothetical protein
MKKPQICNTNVAICEDCEHWEPIPFHHKGGECIPKSAVPVVVSCITPDFAGKLYKVLVNA